MFRVFRVFWGCLRCVLGVFRRCLGAYAFGVLGCLGWGSGVQGFRCLVCLGCLGILGFGRTKTTRNSILTLEKCSKQLKNEVWTKMR